MHHQQQRFRAARDTVELSLGSAFADVEQARERLDALAAVVDDRSEADALRGALELLAYAIEALTLAIGQLAADGRRRR